MKAIPFLRVFHPIYHNVLLSFYKSKHIKCFEMLSPHEVFEQPIWGNQYFRIKESCLYSKQWIKKKVLYVKDLINENGVIKDDNELYDMLTNRRNVFSDIYIVKNYVLIRIKDFDCSIAKYVKIRSIPTVLFKNKLHVIADKKSKFFYLMLVSRQTAKPHIETLYAREFNFHNIKSVWQRFVKYNLLNFASSILKYCTTLYHVARL